MGAWAGRLFADLFELLISGGLRRAAFIAAKNSPQNTIPISLPHPDATGRCLVVEEEFAAAHD